MRFEHSHDDDARYGASDVFHVGGSGRICQPPQRPTRDQAAPGGLLLPEETWQAKILVGGGLGSLSLFLYKVVTVTLSSKAKLTEKVVRKSIPSEDLEFFEE